MEHQNDLYDRLKRNAVEAEEQFKKELKKERRYRIKYRVVALLFCLFTGWLTLFSVLNFDPYMSLPLSNVTGLAALELLLRILWFLGTLFSMLCFFRSAILFFTCGE